MSSVADLCERLTDLSVDVDERHGWAHELAALGDPRLDGALVEIPAGTLHHRRSPDAPPEPTDMPAFRMQRHLVTVHEYRAFIDAGGYDDPSLWTSEGWSWRLDTDAERPRFWNEDEWEAYLVPNHPVVGVCWFEADAYASFCERRLPTEREIERASRGDDARAFPWGDTFDPLRCAHRTHGRRTTKPIGLFPPSPLGVFDVVGSVWQWTADGAGADGDYGPARVVRGGAWNNLPWSIGCGARNAYPPTAQFSNVGFRCAQSIR